MKVNNNLQISLSITVCFKSKLGGGGEEKGFEMKEDEGIDETKKKRRKKKEEEKKRKEKKKKGKTSLIPSTVNLKPVFMVPE